MATGEATLLEIYNLLISAEDDASKGVFAAHIAERYLNYSDEELQEFFEQLAALQSEKKVSLFQSFTEVANGLATLVKIREHLGRKKPIQELDQTLTAAFYPNKLELWVIEWEPNEVLTQNIIDNERVHYIEGKQDLQHRIEPQDRRIYGLFHPSMPDDPVNYIEVAFTQGIASSMEALLHYGREVLDPKDADTAIFYSINACQKGLGGMEFDGISFGGHLIKKVAGELQRDDSLQMKTFSTLSPIPGFVEWLDEKTDKPFTDFTESELIDLAAAYLLEGNDPVAKFHLGNGATLEIINYEADLSENGLKQSEGLMANYVYYTDELETRRETYKATKIVAAPESITDRPIPSIASR